MRIVNIRTLQKMRIEQISQAIEEHGRLRVDSPRSPHVFDIVKGDIDREVEKRALVMVRRKMLDSGVLEQMIQARAEEIAAEHKIALEAEMERRVGKIVGSTLMEMLQNGGQIAQPYHPAPVPGNRAFMGTVSERIESVPEEPALLAPAPRQIEDHTAAVDPAPPALKLTPVPVIPKREKPKTVKAPNILFDSLGSDDEDDEDEVPPKAESAPPARVRKVPSPDILLDGMGDDGQTGRAKPRQQAAISEIPPPPRRNAVSRAKMAEEYAGLIRSGKTSKEAREIMEKKYKKGA